MSLEDELYQQRVGPDRGDRGARLSALTAIVSTSRTPFRRSWPSMARRPPSSLSRTSPVRIAGRILTIRRMGKAGFAHLSQNGERLQIYVRKDAVRREGLRAL